MTEFIGNVLIYVAGPWLTYGFMTYWLHRAAHKGIISPLSHAMHHKTQSLTYEAFFVVLQPVATIRHLRGNFRATGCTGRREQGSFGRGYRNLVRNADTGVAETIEEIIIQVLPLILLTSLWPNSYWLWGYYILFGVILSGPLEHNPKIKIPLLVEGRFHCDHHRQPSCNFGTTDIVWDHVFGTAMSQRGK